MYCEKCGAEMPDGGVFCPSCGNKNNTNAERIKSANGRIFNKIWNASWFNELAIRFDHFSDYFLFALYLLLAILCFVDNGWGDFVLGIISLVIMAFYGFKVYKRIAKRKEIFASNQICPSCGKKTSSSNFCSNCGAQMPKIQASKLEDERVLTEKYLKEKKKKLIWTPILALVIIIMASTGIIDRIGGYSPIKWTKDITFNGRYNSVGEMIDNHFTKPKWKEKKIDSDSYYVIVEGYNMDLAEDVRITFRFEKFYGGCQVSVSRIELLESYETYTDDLSIKYFFDDLDE